MNKRIPVENVMFEISPLGTARRVLYNGKLSHPYGTVKDNGYTELQINGVKHYVHRLVAQAYLPDWDPRLHVDHIDRTGYPLDNSVDNLRMATPQENMRNKPTSRGVYFEAWTSKWKAYIGIDERQITLGRFNTEAEALLARRQAERDHFGEFAPCR